MLAQEFQIPKRISAIFKNLNSIVSKVKNTKLSMTDMKQKDAINLDVFN